MYIICDSYQKFEGPLDIACSIMPPAAALQTFFILKIVLAVDFAANNFSMFT